MDFIPLAAPGGGFYSPLSTALFFVLLHSGSHGLSVCEALKMLVRHGYSKLLNSVHTRAVQVKSALRSCPAFKEIEGRKFVLRFDRQNEHRINPIRLCKKDKVCGKKRPKIDKDFIMEGSCDRQAAAVERDIRVQGTCNEARVIQEKDRHLVGSCTQERVLHLVGSCDTPTTNNERTQPLNGKKHEIIERCCPSDQKHWGCIQHTSLGSLYSDRVNQSGRGDIKESAFVLRGKDPGDVSCSLKDTDQEGKLQLGRCRRTDGKRWQCAKQVQLGSIYCEHHHIMRRGGYKAKVVDVVRAGATSPSIRPSEAFSGKSVIKEEEGICYEPLKLANGSLCVSTAQAVANSCEISAKEELNEAQDETKPFLHTLESHDLEDARRSKIKAKLAGLGQSVMVKAAMQEGQKERTPDPHVVEEVRHEGKEETKQYLHKLGVDDLEDVERSKKEENLTWHGQPVTVEGTIHEGQQITKPDLNTLEKGALEAQEKKVSYLRTVELHDQLRSMCNEHPHLTWKRGTKANAEGMERVVRADLASQLQSSVIPFKLLLDKDFVREEDYVVAEPSRLATGPFGGSVAQVVMNSHKISVEVEFHKVHKETRPFLPRLELYDLEAGVQRLKKKQNLTGHGQSVLLEKHEGQEETKPDQHTFKKVRYEVKQETTPKLHAVELHNLEDAHRPNEAPKLAGHGQMMIPEKTVQTAKLDSHVPASDGSGHVQRSQEDSMSRVHRSSMIPELKNEVSYNTSEDGTEMYKGKGRQIELSNLEAKMQVAVKRSLVDQRDSSSSRQALFPDRSLHLSNERQSAGVCTDAPGQCHRKDGKGWQCSCQCKPGCIYCEHHQGRLSRTAGSGKKKMILQLELDKQVLATCLKGSSETQVLRVAIDVPETLVKGLKTKVTHCTGVVEERDARHDGQTSGASSIANSLYGRIEERRKVTGLRDIRYEWQTIPTIRLASFTGRSPEETTAAKDKDASQFGRCHRKDGKGWQCSQQCKHGSIYCDRHQRQRSKSQFPCGSQHKLAFSRGPDVQNLEYASDRGTDVKQPSHFSIHVSNSGLEHALKPKLQGQEVETRSRKQNDLGLASSSLGIPVRTFDGSCLWEANKTSEQAVKAEGTLKKCHRRDGKKWQCSRLCMPGYNHCEHHQGRGRKVKVKT